MNKIAKIIRKYRFRLSTRTFVLALMTLLASFSYFFYHQGLYFVHKFFLGDYVQGLSLSKPLFFFFFLLFWSIIYDILKKTKISAIKWIIYQTIILVSIVVVSSIGFIVFSQNLKNYNELTGSDIPLVRDTKIQYLNYETNSLFYYSEAAAKHNHENKALFYPLFKLVNIEGDIGASIYPFYPKPFLVAGYLLFIFIFIALVHSFKALKYFLPNGIIGSFLLIYYLFVVWRLIHISIDGGIFTQIFYLDVFAFIFISVAFLNNFIIRGSIWILVVLLFFYQPFTVISSEALHGLFSLDYGEGLGFGGKELSLYFYESALVISSLGLFNSINKKRITKTSYKRIINHPTVVMSLVTISVIFLYLGPLSSINNFSALDNPEEMVLKYFEDLFLIETSRTEKPLCNAPLYKTYKINSAHINIYNFTDNITCDRSIRAYYYPIRKDVRDEIKLIEKCSESIGLCPINLDKRYEFFRFDAASDLKGKQVYRAKLKNNSG